MEAIVTWLQLAPQGAIALVTAVLGALVAVIVVFLTQWILARRARTELLTKKLEDLYLLLNEASSNTINRFETIVALTQIDAIAASGEMKFGTEMYELVLHKKIVMYVRLYFPQLAQAHQNVFSLNRAINEIIHDLSNDKSADYEKIKVAFEGYGDALRSMEEEIIKNKPRLVRDSYKFWGHTRVA